jgi:ABC-type branched-subunit amino acid transport system substrate-binding protein
MDRRTLLGASCAALAGTCAFARAAEPGVSDNEILLGQSAVLSGPLSPGAIAAQQGAKLLFDEVNAQGGVAERRLRLLAMDDGLDPAKAVGNYRALVQQHGVLACFLGVGAGSTLAAAPVLREAGVSLVGATAVVDSVREKTAGVAYYTRASQMRECEGLVQHLETLGIQQIAIATLATPGGQEVASQLTTVMERFKLRPKGVVEVAPDGSNAADAGRQLAAQQPQAAILFLTGAPAAALIQSVRAAGSEPAFYGMSILSGEVTMRLLNGRSRGLAIAQVTPYPWDGASTDAVQYRRLADKASVPIGYHSYEGYLAARVMVEALGRLGRDLTRTKLQASLRNLRLRVAGVDIDFGSGRHTGSRFVELVHVRPDGSFVR